MRCAPPSLAFLLALAAGCGDEDGSPADAGPPEGVRIVRVGGEELALDLRNTESFPGPCTARKVGLEMTGRCSYDHGEDQRLASITYEDTTTPEEVTTTSQIFGWDAEDLVTVEISRGLGDGGSVDGTWTLMADGSVRDIVYFDGELGLRERSTFGPDAVGPLAPLDCDRLLGLNGEQQILVETRDHGDDGSIESTIEYSYDAEPGPGVTRTRVGDHSDYDAPNGRDDVLVFTYDDAARLVERSEDELPADGTFRVTTYAWDGDRLVSAGDVEYVYDAGGNLVGTIVGGTGGAGGSGEASSVTIHDYSCWSG